MLSTFYCMSAIDIIYGKNSNIVKYYCNKKMYFFLIEYIVRFNLFLWCKAEFSASLLQSSVSHDSEINIICWYAAQETLLIINFKNSCTA